jgi:hypothetical protein
MANALHYFYQNFYSWRSDSVVINDQDGWLRFFHLDENTKEN